MIARIRQTLARPILYVLAFWGRLRWALHASAHTFQKTIRFGSAVAVVAVREEEHTIETWGVRDGKWWAKILRDWTFHLEYRNPRRKV